MHYRDMGYLNIVIITVTGRFKVVQLLLPSANQRAVVGERGVGSGEGDVLVWERSGGGVRTYRDWDCRRRVLVSSLFRPLLQLSGQQSVSPLEIHQEWSLVEDDIAVDPELASVREVDLVGPRERLIPHEDTLDHI